MEDIIYSLKLYTENGIKPGGFLTAVLENNLMESFGRADHINRNRIGIICNYIYNDLPSSCHGSAEIVNAWKGNKPN